MSLHNELETEQVSHLILTGFTQVESGTSISDTIQKMRQERQNVCLITHNDQLAGIFTDRDLLRKVITQSNYHQPIDNVMTPDPVVVSPDFSAAEALRLMDRRNFRHLPVVNHNGSIVGTMTDQTILNYLAARYPTVILNRPLDPDLIATTPEGGD